MPTAIKVFYGIVILALLSILYMYLKGSPDGLYRKIDGNGGVYQNSYLSISQSGDADIYNVVTYDERGKEELHAEGTKKGDKLIWTDKVIPMEISFQLIDRAILRAGNGAFGEYSFKKMSQQEIYNSPIIFNR